MYLKNQRYKKTNDKKSLKPLKATSYSKIKNRQRKTKNKDLSIQNQIVEPTILPKEKNNEIEQYFLKRVGDVSRSKLNAELTKQNISETIDKTKVQKSEFDLINQYLDCSRITAFNNYLSNKELPKFNLFKQEDETKNLRASKEFNLSNSKDVSEMKDQEQYSIDYLVKQFTEPFEKNKIIYFKRSQMVRKELMEVYQLNFLESSKSEDQNSKNKVDCAIQTSMIHPITSTCIQEKDFNSLKKSPKGILLNEVNIIDSETKSSEIKSSEILITDEFFKKSSQPQTKSNLSFKTKFALKDLKLEDLYYD